MQVTETNADGLKREFKVVISAAALEAKKQARLAEVARTVRVPGFRPGKVPMPMLQKKYGPSVMGEVLEAAVNDGTQQLLVEKAIRPAVQPKVEITSYPEGGDLEFSVAVETLPEVTPIDLATIELERPVAVVTDEEVDSRLKVLAGRQDKSEAVTDERACVEGDIAVIDFVGKLDGVAFEGGTGEAYPLKLGSGSFIPGFEEQLVGHKAGEAVTVKVSFPDDYQAAELAGKAVEFDVTIKELRAPVDAPIDDELAKAYGLDDLEALKKALRESVEREYAGLSREHAKRKLLDVLAEKHDFLLPEGMVSLEFDAIWKQIEDAKAEGQLEAEDQGKTDDELKAEYRDLAGRRVRLGLVLSEVGRANSINVNQEDLNRAVMAEARRYPGQEHMVFKYYQSNQEAMNSLRAPIFEEKVIDFIIELAKVTDKTVSIDELKKAPGETGTAEAPAAEAKPKKKAAKKKTEAQEE